MEKGSPKVLPAVSSAASLAAQARRPPPRHVLFATLAGFIFMVSLLLVAIGARFLSRSDTTCNGYTTKMKAMDDRIAQFDRELSALLSAGLKALGVEDVLSVPPALNNPTSQHQLYLSVPKLLSRTVNAALNAKNAHVKTSIEEKARKVGEWAAASIQRDCRPCEDCRTTEVLTGPPCNQSTLARYTCSCPVDVDFRQLAREGLPEVNGQRKLCEDGAAPGEWVTYSKWQPYSCRYRGFSMADLRSCLRGKWIHFFGDSTSRLLAGRFSELLGIQRRDWKGDKSRTDLMDTDADGEAAEGRKGAQSVLPRVTYLFRGKMAHQRHPQKGFSGARDMNNWFLKDLKKPGAKQPDFLVLGVGAHEVIGWSNRPPPDLSLDVFKNDTAELLALLKETFTRGKLIWWKAQCIFPGKVSSRNYFEVRRFHKMYQDHAFNEFKKAGYMVADFYQTTKDRFDQVFHGDGTHYKGFILDLHAQIIANLLCNEPKRKGFFG